MNTFFELAKSRNSVRNYKEKPVEKEKLDIILESGRIAPTAANQQPCKFLVLENKNSIEKLQNACNPYNAPLAIIVCADKNIAWTRPFDKNSMIEIDATIATDHMMLCAQDLGLNSCWITYFHPDELIKQFNIPKNLVPVNILIIGYSDDKETKPKSLKKDRKPIKYFVEYV